MGLYIEKKTTEPVTTHTANLLTVQLQAACTGTRLSWREEGGGKGHQSVAAVILERELASQIHILRSVFNQELPKYQ